MLKMDEQLTINLTASEKLWNWYGGNSHWNKKKEKRREEVMKQDIICGHIMNFLFIRNQQEQDNEKYVIFFSECDEIDFFFSLLFGLCNS